MGDLELCTPRTTEIALSGPLLALAGAAIAAAGSVLLIALAVFSWGSVQLLRGWMAEHRLHSLAAQITTLDWRTAAFADSLAGLWAREDRKRLVAGLDPLNPDVTVGMGGLRGPLGGWSPYDRSWAEGSSLAQTLAGVDARVDLLTRQATIVAASVREVRDSLSAYTMEEAVTPSIMPTAGFISSGFAAIRDHPILHEDLPHDGIDIAAAYGSRVLAPAAGRVVTVAKEPRYGLMVVLDHGHGLQTLYAHLSKAVAHAGDTVTRGDLIGLVGTSGLSTGPHLHYEVRVNGRPVNPREFVVPDAFFLVHRTLWEHKRNPRPVR